MHKLSEQLLELALMHRARHQPAPYAMAASGSNSAAMYTLRTQTGRGPLVITGIEKPGTDALVNIRANGQQYTDGDVYAPHIFDDYTSTDDPGRLTAPIVLDEAAQLRISATAIATSDLPTDELLVWGFHTDVHFGDLLKRLGEFSALSLDTGALSAATQFTRQEYSYDRKTYIERIMEEERVGGESGLTWSEPSLQVGNVELHPDRSGRFPSKVQKAGVLCGLWVGVGSKVVLRGGMTGTPGNGRVTVTLAGRREYSNPGRN